MTLLRLKVTPAKRQTDKSRADSPQSEGKLFLPLAFYLLTHHSPKRALPSGGGRAGVLPYVLRPENTIKTKPEYRFFPPAQSVVFPLCRRITVMIRNHAIDLNKKTAFISRVNGGRIPADFTRKGAITLSPLLNGNKVETLMYSQGSWQGKRDGLVRETAS